MMVWLFLTSKVRLHCDSELQGRDQGFRELFLTSKVRLHCDLYSRATPATQSGLFLTSKVRLHCDERVGLGWRWRCLRFS